MKKKGEVFWELDDVTPVDKFDDLEKEIETSLRKVDGYATELANRMTVEKFKEIILFCEGLSQKISRLVYLPELSEAIDQKDRRAKLLKARANDLSLKYAEKVRKIYHWIKGFNSGLDEENAKRLFAAVPDLKYVLEYSRKAAKYSLSEREENIVDNKDVNGIEALTDLRTMIETEFKYRLKVYKVRKLSSYKVIETQAELMALVHSPKAELREAAYRALFEKHEENSDKFFLIYQAAVKDWGFEARLRGYSSPISMRNFKNQVSDRAVETLMRVVAKNTKVFNDFFRYKAKKLGVEKLSRFDLYAPISSKVNKVIKFIRAKEMVLEAFEGFSPKFAEYGRKIFEDKHVDSHPRIGKRSGAFCATVGPAVIPYIMLNHTDKIRDVSTLAHELGHGIHSLYANQHYPSSQQAGLPLAETASTFGEMVLFEKMIRETDNSQLREEMLFEKMSDSYATIMRQTYMVDFEIKAHETIQKGVSADGLSELWFKTLEDQFGESVSVDKIFGVEWSYIPHIVESPFYCYAYSFGELLSYSLFSRYKNEGAKFVPKIEKILAAGGSEDPGLVLKKVGIDIESEEFWQDGFEIIKEWSEKLIKV